MLLFLVTLRRLGAKYTEEKDEKTKNYLKEIYKANKQMVLYLFFGVCTTVINIVCYGIWNEILSLNNITSTILAWLVAVFFAFVTNKVYVFESQRTKTSERLSEMASFFSVGL